MKCLLLFLSGSEKIRGKGWLDELKRGRKDIQKNHDVRSRKK